MTAIAIDGKGGPEVLVPREMAVPSPAEGQVLLRVQAAGVNRPDVMQRSGLYPPPPGAPDTPGLEVAGTVVAVGDAVDPELRQRRLGDHFQRLARGVRQKMQVQAGHCAMIDPGRRNGRLGVVDE